METFFRPPLNQAEERFDKLGLDGLIFRWNPSHRKRGGKSVFHPVTDAADDGVEGTGKPTLLHFGITQGLGLVRIKGRKVDADVLGIHGSRGRQEQLMR